MSSLPPKTNVELARALGVPEPERASSVVLELRAGKLAEVIVRYAVTADAVEKVQRLRLVSRTLDE